MPTSVAGRIYFLIGTAALFLLSLHAYEFSRALAAMVFFVATMVAIATAPGNLGILSWSAGVPAFYALFFLLIPLILRLAGKDDPQADPEVSAALYVASAGMTAFVLGTNAMRFAREPRLPDLPGLLRMNLTGARAAVLIAVGGAAMLWSYVYGYFGLIATEGVEAGSWAGPIGALAFLLTIAHVMAWNAYFTTGRMLSASLLTTVLLCGFGVLANSKAMMITPIAMIGITMWGVRDRFPWKLFALSILLYVFVAYPFVTASRLAFAAGSLNRLELFDIAVDYLRSWHWIEDAADLDAVESLGRWLLPYFADVVSQAGNAVPFMEGRTFAEAFDQLLPRFLSPDKPDMSIGNWTAKAFGAIEQDNYITNLSPTYMGEFYMNLGLDGVCAGMFVTGIVAVLVDRYLIVRRGSWTMPIFVSFIGWHEAFLGHTISPFLKQAPLWLAILFALKLLSKPVPPDAASRATVRA